MHKLSLNYGKGFVVIWDRDEIPFRDFMRRILAAPISKKLIASASFDRKVNRYIATLDNKEYSSNNAVITATWLARSSFIKKSGDCPPNLRVKRKVRGV